MKQTYNIHNRREWPQWARQWERDGDDIACPECGERAIETHEHTTHCLNCQWQDFNPVAALNDEAEHG